MPLLKDMEIFWITSISLVLFYGFCGIHSTQCPLGCAESSENGSLSCNLTTTDCLYGCKLGYAGLNCSVKCPTTCSFDSQGGGEICHARSGKCFGCKDGYYGSICNNECSDIDTNCRKCSVMPNDSVVCDICEPNFYRDNGTCTACNYWCAVNVTSPQQSCRETDGYCIFGCKDGRFGPRCDRSSTSSCIDVCGRDTGTDNMITILIVLGFGWLLSLVLTIVLIVMAIRSKTLCKVCCDKGSANHNQGEMTGTKDRLQHVYMTLDEESSFSKSSEMYTTLNKDKVCKHGNIVAGESQRENRNRDNKTAQQFGNLYAVTKLETEYQNLNIEEGSTSVFGKELTYLNLETNDE